MNIPVENNEPIAGGITSEEVAANYIKIGKIKTVLKKKGNF